MSDQATEFEGWAVLELMGHRKLAGYVRPATIAGAGVLRIDVPRPLDQPQEEPILATQFYSPSALYCLTPVDETVARNLAKAYQPEPVARWELPETIEVDRRQGEATARLMDDDPEHDLP